MPWSTEPPADGNSTVLHAGRDVVLGRFRCLPDDPLWRTENVVARGALMVFPGTCVELSRGRDRIVADRTRVVLYAEGQTYRRAVVHPAGDHCVFLRLRDSLVRELGEAGARRPDAASDRWVAVPSSNATYARLRELVVRITAGRGPELTEVENVEEELLAIVAAVALDPAEAVRAAPQAWLDAADGVRVLLASADARRITLAAAAQEVGYSPFHLARVFRAVTGSSIHEYAERLRLRRALDRVVDGERDLATLATELGFASHSHLTARFRRAFGRPPSTLRAAGMLSGFDLRS